MKEFELKITEEELQIIGAALVELPYRVSAELIGKINKQISDQDKDNSQ